MPEIPYIYIHLTLIYVHIFLHILEYVEQIVSIHLLLFLVPFLMTDFSPGYVSPFPPSSGAH